MNRLRLTSLNKIKKWRIKSRWLSCACWVRDWRVIFAFVILVGLLNFVSIFSQLVTVEIVKLENIPPTPRRIGPVYVKGIYISSWTASEPALVDGLINFILRTELNGAVIDIKDSSGTIAYATNIPQAQKWASYERRIKDIKELLKKFQSQGIYTIGRIAVFQDPVLAEKRPDLALRDKRTGKIWRDTSGLAWVDPASEEVWAYNVALAREALELGFDEVNFDYIRFPSDGSLENISYPFWQKNVSKYDVIRGFFEYQDQNLAGLGPCSADLFGMTLWHADTGFDMNIGQRLADAIPYFDYICPMVYPSHYPASFEGFANPAEHPYEVISGSFGKAVPLLVDQDGLKLEKPKIRPWLQAFDMGARYTPEMISLQKQAVIDGDGYGWIFWNARNDYFKIEPALKGHVPSAHN